jgi:hypothetical protein
LPAPLLDAPLERSQLAVRMFSGITLLEIQKQFLGATTWIDFKLQLYFSPDLGEGIWARTPCA